MSPRAGLAGPAFPARAAGRFLEQQSTEPALRQPQQEHHVEPEQQQRLPGFEYTPIPEPERSRPRRARSGVSRARHDEAGAWCTPGAAPVLALTGDRRRVRLDNLFTQGHCHLTSRAVIKSGLQFVKQFRVPIQQPKQIGHGRQRSSYPALIA